MKSADHLSRAFINLESRMLGELNHLRAMINLLLPPLYQQHYVAQVQPQLYQPIQPATPNPPYSPVTRTDSVSVDTESSTPSTTDAMQNESPLAGSDGETDTNTESLAATDDQTERVLEFKPVQKKQNDRIKSIQK